MGFYLSYVVCVSCKFYYVYVGVFTYYVEGEM